MKPDNKDSQFEPEKSPIFHACIVVAVGKDAMGEVRPCACDRNKYYVHGIENHYVRAADYDELLSLHRADQTLIASLREQNNAFRKALEYVIVLDNLYVGKDFHDGAMGSNEAHLASIVDQMATTAENALKPLEEFNEQ
jgi:aspartyl aminopeptidase